MQNETVCLAFICSNSTKDFTSSDFLSVFKVDIRMNKAVDDEKTKADFPADSTGKNLCSCSNVYVFERKSVFGESV